MKLKVLVCVSVLASGSLLAQQSTTPMIIGAAPIEGQATLRIGTEIPLRLLEEVTTKGKFLHAGQRVHMETAEAVIVQGNTVIPAGSPAVGEITSVINKGMWGKSGHLSGRPLYVIANGRQIRLSGSFDDKGSAGGGAAVAVSALVFLPAGFFMTGTSARLPIGAVIRSFVEEDVPLQIAAATPPAMPLTVAAPATVAISPSVAAPVTISAPAGVKLIPVSVPAAAVPR